MFCREQVAQLRGIVPALDALGVGLVAIGNGSPAEARRFADSRELPFPLLTNPDLEAYAAAGMRRDLAASVNVATFANAARALRSGHRQGWTQGNPWQQGGALLVDGDGEVLWSHVARASGDHPSGEQIVAAVRERLEGTASEASPPERGRR